MKPLFEIISEASKNEKRRNLDVSKKMFINGKSYNNIMCFAILSAVQKIQIVKAIQHQTIKSI